MWPWSRIRKLEEALYAAQRENRLLTRRAEWLDNQWARTKQQLKLKEKE